MWIARRDKVEISRTGKIGVLVFVSEYSSEYSHREIMKVDMHEGSMYNPLPLVETSWENCE